MKIVNALTPKLVTSVGNKSEFISMAESRKKLTIALQHGLIGAGKKIVVKVLNSTSVSGTDAKTIMTLEYGKDAETPAKMEIIDLILSGEMYEYFAIEISGTAESLYCSAIIIYDSKYSE